MKVKSGKLQIGDVKVWKDGERETITQDKLDATKEDFRTIEWILEEPTDVKCIKRKGTKSPWKKTGKMLDKMIDVGLMVKVYEGQRNTFVCIIDNLETETNKICGDNDNIHLSVKQAYEYARENGWL